MILVFGASGTIGRHLVHLLRDADVTAFVRDPVKGEELGCRYVVGDLDDPAAVAAALRGADRVFLNAGGAQPSAGEQPMVGQQRTVIDAAVEAGVGYVVKLSVWHARVWAAGWPKARTDWSSSTSRRPAWTGASWRRAASCRTS